MMMLNQTLKVATLATLGIIQVIGGNIIELLVLLNSTGLLLIKFFGPKTHLPRIFYSCPMTEMSPVGMWNMYRKETAVMQHLV